MNICRCLFWKQNGKIAAVCKSADGTLEVLRLRGNYFVEYTPEYWDTWKKHSGYCKGEATDFCFIYDTPFEIPSEYMCSTAQKTWSDEKISIAAEMLGITECTEIYSDNRLIARISSSRHGNDRKIMYTDYRKVVSVSRKIIKFGTWESKPLEWTVLQEDDFSMLVICKTAVVKRNFNPQRSDGNSWASSDIRCWLNNNFWNIAFTDEEKRKVVNTYLEDPDATKDNVFLLSQSEAENLMTQPEREQGSYWCLRSAYPEKSNCEIYAVDRSGNVCSGNMQARYNIFPCILIKKSS